MMTAFMLLSIIPTQLKAATDTNPVVVAASKTVESADANANLARLDEINAMDKSALSSSEKKDLRHEVRAIKDAQDGRGGRYNRGHGRRYHDGGNGDNVRVQSSGTVYFMGGGGLLIILLIILLI